MRNIDPRRIKPASTLSSSAIPPTAEAALAAIKAWDDLTDGRRRDLRSGIRFLGRLMGRPHGTIVLDPPTIQAALDATTAAACDLTESTFRAYRSFIRYVMRRLGVLANPARQGTGELSPPWVALLADLPDRFQSMRLVALARFASARGLEPSEVVNATLDEFVEHLRTADIRQTAWERARRAAAAWNRAAEIAPGWPATRLIAPSPPSSQYSLPFSAFPTSLQEDLARFEARLRPATPSGPAGSGGGLYSGDGPIVPLRPATVRTHMIALRLAAAALVHSGMPRERITGLCVFVERANRRAIMEWHFTRTGGRRTELMGSIANALRIVGKHHVGLRGKELEELADDLARARPPKQKGMTAKNASRLRQLEDPGRRAALLLLPARLMNIATQRRDGWVDAAGTDHPSQAKRGAWLASIAVSVEILLNCPLRLSNLAALRIGVHLQDAEGRGRRWTHIVIEPHEVKNGRRISWEIGRETSDVITRYIQEFRPLIAHPGSDWLLPSRDHADRPRDKATLGTSITDIIHDHVGVRMNPHLFRAFAGAQILEETPHAIDDVREVLVHEGFETARRHYRAENAKGATRRFSGLISRKRKLSQRKPSGDAPRPLDMPSRRRRRK